MSCICFVEAALGRSGEASVGAVIIGSVAPSFDFRLPERPLVRFSMPSLVNDLASLATLAGSSEGAVVRVLGSSFVELEVLEDECFRWCV